MSQVAGGLVVVRALPVDAWREFREVRLAALANDPAAYSTKLSDWQGAGDTEERWRKRLGARGSITFLATIEGKAAGIASGFPGTTPEVRELISMWVAPFARGRGVGDALLEAVIDWAAREGAESVVLAVYTTNTRANALYARAGFVETGAPGDEDEHLRREVTLRRRIDRSGA